jgi:hypothetical protein
MMKLKWQLVQVEELHRYWQLGQLALLEALVPPSFLIIFRSFLLLIRPCLKLVEQLHRPFSLNALSSL